MLDGDRLSYLPRLLYETFGNAAVPYLENALRGATGRFAQVSIATQLIAAGVPAGFQFTLREIERNSTLRLDLIGVLKGRFPELRDAGDDAIVAIIKERAGH